MSNPTLDELELFWESLNALQQRAVEHSANQQARRARIALPETIRKVIPDDFADRIKYGILRDIYAGKAELSAYELDYRAHLETTIGPRNPEVAGINTAGGGRGAAK